MKGRGTRLYDFREQIFDDQLKAAVTNPHKKNFKLFDFFANCEYFEDESDYDEVIDVPKPGTGGGNGGGGGAGRGGPPADWRGLRTLVGAEGVVTGIEEAVGREG